jgi:hypothetical protein
VPQNGAGSGSNADDDITVLAEFKLVNEYAVVRVRKILTRNGERMEIHAPRLGYTIRLDALACEGLSWQSPQTIGKFLETPFGPGHSES